MAGFSGAGVRIRSIPLAANFSWYSPALWVSRTLTSVRWKSTVRFPVEALEASTRSSVSFFSRADWRSRTSRYSRAWSLGIACFFSRST